MTHVLSGPGWHQCVHSYLGCASNRGADISQTGNFSTHGKLRSVSFRARLAPLAMVLTATWCGSHGFPSALKNRPEKNVNQLEL